MSVLQQLKSVLPGDDESITSQMYECRECGATFESAKSSGRVMCEDCNSTDVRMLE